MIVEEWRMVAGFPGYEVSSLGRVRSWRIWGRTKVRPKKPRVLRPATHPKGYQQLSLRRYGASVAVKVHRLVLAAFVGTPPPGFECGHIDGNPKNNKVENLVWLTAKENTQHKFKHKTMPGKINEKNVAAIRVLAASGKAQYKIAEQFGLSKGNISLIVSRKTWRHV